MTFPPFGSNERGNISILFALGFAASAFMSAIAVDGVSLYQERRHIQSMVDLAAISAASDPSAAFAIAQSVMVEAGLLSPGDTEGLSVTTGVYRPDPNVAVADRFTPGATGANAVHVAFQRPGRLIFASSFTTPPMISAAGLAAVTPEVSFSLGSRLASLNGGIANAVLSQLLGTNVSLSVADYSALASARVDALSFLDGLASQMGLSAGTYHDILAMDAGSGSIAAALAGLTNGTARTALHGLAGGGSAGRVNVGSLIALGHLDRLSLGSGGLAAGLSLSPLEILTAAAALADGDRQVSLGLGASVPGLASLTLDLAIGEPPQGGGWFSIGPIGTMVRTAQIRLRLSATLLGGPVLLGASVKLPLWIDIAHAEAQVISAACPSASAPNGRATVAVRPGIVHAAIGEMSQTTLAQFGWVPPVLPVRMIDVLLLRVTGSAQVEIAQTDPVLLSFSSTEIGTATMKTARTTTIVTSLAGSLLGSLNLTVNVLGLGLSSPAVIAGAVRSLVMPLAPTLDMTINAALSALGLGLGEADVRVYSVRCTSPVLVG